MKSLLTCILLHSLLSGFSQYTLTTFNKANSDLPDNYVFNAEFDADGICWIGLGLQVGLVRYDGASWNHYRMEGAAPHANSISDILWAPDSTMYLCGYGASSGSRITHWVNENEWTDITPDHMGYVSEGLVHNNSLWFAESYSGLYEYNLSSETWQLHNGLAQGYTIGGFDVDQDNIFWIGHASGKLIRFRDEILSEVEIYPLEAGVSKRIEVVKAIKKDRSIWLGGTEGLAHLDSLGNKTLYNEGNTGMALDDIASIAFDSAGNIWLGSTSNGLFIWDGNNHQAFGAAVLGSNSVRDIEADAEGNMWVSTWNGGITKFALTPNAVGDVWSYKPVTIVPTVIRTGEVMSIMNPSRQSLKSFQLFTEDGRLLVNQALNSDDELFDLRTPSLIQGKFVGRVVGSNGQVHTSIVLVQ